MESYEIGQTIQATIALFCLSAIATASVGICFRRSVIVSGIDDLIETVRHK